MAQLKEKHPNPQPAKLGSLLFGPIDDAIPETLYSEINGEMVRQAALRTNGAGGPSGIDANGFRRVREVIRRIIGKCVMNIAKKDVVEASGSLQLCGGQKTGS